MIKITVLSVLMSIFFFGSVTAAETDCVQCHDELTRGKSIHAAVAMGCTVCHTAIDAAKTPHRVKNKDPKGLSSPQPGLCFGCHDKSLFEKKNMHGALGIGCTACHNPHASGYERLMRAQMPDLCYSCHDSSPFTRRNIHPPVASGQCAFCHSPHSSENELLLVKPLADLCAACHDDKSGKHVLAGFGLGDVHPVKGKRDPSRAGKELTCASCHAPHSSDARFLFIDLRADANLCLACHVKIMVKP